MNLNQLMEILTLISDETPLADRAKENFGRRVLALAESLIVNIAPLLTYSTTIVDSWEMVISDARNALASLREFSATSSDTKAVEGLLANIEVASRGSEVYSAKDLYNFGGMFARYASRFLSKPSDYHAVALYYALDSSRRNNEVDAWEKTIGTLKHYVETEKSPWRSVYGARYFELMGLVYKRGFNPSFSVDYKRAFEYFEKALECGSALKGTKHYTPGIVALATSHLWELAVSLLDWKNVEKYWTELYTASREYCEEHLAYNPEFYRIILQLAGTERISPQQRKELASILRIGVSAKLTEEQRKTHTAALNSINENGNKDKDSLQDRGRWAKNLRI